jgi:DNA-binding response OmpR family regulator
MPRVVFADDDAILHRLLAVNFRAAGIDLDPVSRGDEALARVTADPPDALILDATMPGMSGHDVYRQLRSDPRLSSLPVIFLTGRSAEEFEDYAAENVHVVTKPFDPTNLVALVREMIGAAG